MVRIGKTVRYDKFGRITCPSELAELLDLEKGVDEVEWCVENGTVIVRKMTKIYGNGFDFESDEIRDRLIAYEKRYIDYSDEEFLDPAEQEARAYQQYLEDKRERELRKGKEYSSD